MPSKACAALRLPSAQSRPFRRRSGAAVCKKHHTAHGGATASTADADRVQDTVMAAQGGRRSSQHRANELESNFSSDWMARQCRRAGTRRPFGNAHRGVGFLRWAWARGQAPSGIMSGLLGATTHCVAAPRRSSPRPARSSQVPPQVPSARMQSLALHSDCVMAPLRHGGATVQ